MTLVHWYWQEPFGIQWQLIRFAARTQRIIIMRTKKRTRRPDLQSFRKRTVPTIITRTYMRTRYKTAGLLQQERMECKSRKRPAGGGGRGGAGGNGMQLKCIFSWTSYHAYIHW